jgi:hypothetical protein
MQTDRERQAAMLIEQALIEVDAIEHAKDLRYADEDAHSYNARRKMTMKDAKLKARHASRLMRQAWELLEPTNR